MRSLLKIIDRVALLPIVRRNGSLRTLLTLSTVHGVVHAVLTSDTLIFERGWLVTGRADRAERGGFDADLAGWAGLAAVSSS